MNLTNLILNLLSPVKGTHRKLMPMWLLIIFIVFGGGCQNQSASPRNPQPPRQGPIGAVHSLTEQEHQAIRDELQKMPPLEESLSYEDKILLRSRLLQLSLEKLNLSNKVNESLFLELMNSAFPEKI